jgi:hypothetical protein
MFVGRGFSHDISSAKMYAALKAAEKPTISVILSGAKNLSSI